jgi:L-proline amide hydrolase
MRPLPALLLILLPVLQLVVALNAVDVTEGYVSFEVPSINRTCQTYYKIIGTLRPGVRPLIALHGGPGVNSEYLEILSDVTNGRTGPLIVYDQIGNGLSTHLRETAGNKSFWTVDLFISELKNLLAKLNIKEYDLLGQSWGGMLGSSFAIQRPRGLKHLVLFSSPASMDLWIQAQIALKNDFPEKLRDALDKYDEDHIPTPEYEEAMAYYNSHHLCTLDPFPLPIIHGAEWAARDQTVGNTMYVSCLLRR